jgi:hypothetical protein
MAGIDEKKAIRKKHLIDVRDFLIDMTRTSFCKFLRISTELGVVA